MTALEYLTNELENKAYWYTHSKKEDSDELIRHGIEWWVRETNSKFNANISIKEAMDIWHKLLDSPSERRNTKLEFGNTKIIRREKKQIE